jgi:hypothetical protein
MLSFALGSMLKAARWGFFFLNISNGMMATSSVYFGFHLLAVTNELWEVRK